MNTPSLLNINMYYVTVEPWCAKVIIIIIGSFFSDVSGLLLLLVVVSLMFLGLAFYHVASSVYQTPWIHMVMYYYSDFMDSTFLRIWAVLRIADLWRL